MQVPLELSFHNLEPSEPVESRIRERVSRLERFFDRIISCHVTLEAPHRSQQHALAYHIRIEVRVPQKQLVVNRDPGPEGAHFDAYVLIRDAFDAMERMLEDHARKTRGEVKVHDAPLQGQVVRMFGDYGFVATADGGEVYFHRNSVVENEFDALKQGDPVELVIMEGESPAGPQATTVKPIRPMQLQGQAQR